MIQKTSIGILSITLFAIGCYFFGNSLHPVSFIIIIATLGIYMISSCVNIWNEWLKIRAALDNKKLENERIREFSKQGAILECEFCGKENSVPIRLDIKNRFTCTSCGCENAVLVDIHTARPTLPLSMDEMSTIYNELVEEDDNAES